MQVSDYIVKKYGRLDMPVQDMITGKDPGEVPIQDLVAVILGTGSKKESVFSISERIIRDYNCKAMSQIKDPVKMSAIWGITHRAASKLIAAFELGRRFSAPASEKKLLIRGPEDIYTAYKHIAKYSKEHFIMLCLNTKNYVTHEEVISIGTLTGTLVHPREVFSTAIEHNAGSIIVIHNHPSGEFEPSERDEGITRMLRESGDILRIPLVDHVIIAENGYYSYNKERKI